MYNFLRGHVFISLECVPRSGPNGSRGNSHISISEEMINYCSKPQVKKVKEGQAFLNT